MCTLAKYNLCVLFIIIIFFFAIFAFYISRLIARHEHQLSAIEIYYASYIVNKATTFCHHRVCFFFFFFFSLGSKYSGVNFSVSFCADEINILNGRIVCVSPFARDCISSHISDGWISLLKYRDRLYGNLDSFVLLTMNMKLPTEEYGQRDRDIQVENNSNWQPNNERSSEPANKLMKELNIAISAIYWCN